VKDWWPIAGAVVVLGIASVIIYSAKKNGGQLPVPSPKPTPEIVEQLTPDKQPKVNMAFSSDAHYVTVSIANISAASLEYNLIYDATVKGSSLQTGVNASTHLKGATTYSKKQLLGSESSGKFTYHANIKNAVMELTLRDANNSSVFSATYPFSVIAGSSVDLFANQ